LRRALPLVACLALLLAWTPAVAQRGAETSHGESQGHSSDIWWKWANFAILAAALAHLIRKKAPAFFASRNDEIRKGIEEAAKLRRDAETRAAEIERRLNGLSAEIEDLRRAARQEMAAETERMRQAAEEAVRKIRRHCGQEIDSAAKTARHELRTYSAGLAIRLAEARLRARLTPQADLALVREFASSLGRASRPGEEAR
jgi:F-type H+-transporting ATPase subunit b